MKVITKVDTVSWGTPLVSVFKPNGTIRECADYSATVNEFLVDENYSLQRVDDVFKALQGRKLFSKHDLSNAYNQLILEETTRKLLAWSTHKGVYEVNRFPFGCKPNSAIFQSIIDKTLVSCPGIVSFIDDIVVTGNSDVEHLKYLEIVLYRLGMSQIMTNC